MIQWTDQETWADSISEAMAGETLSVDERLVVAPARGRLVRDRDASEGEYVLEGQVVASVVRPGGDVVPVHSPFAGWVMGFLLANGSPVRASEPVLWLRRL
ncbi:MAG: hypothetical protein ACRDJ4_07995 [Actinomycetota bacterium]